MDTTESVWQSVKPNKYCSCGYKCDCLQLMVKNKISTKRLFLRLEKENETDINLLSINEFGLDEILNQFNHFKYCKAYHSIFHEKQFNRIKRKPSAFQCLHHIEESDEKPHIIHQLIDTKSIKNLPADLDNNIGSISNGNHHYGKRHSKFETSSPTEDALKQRKETDLNEILPNENESLISAHDFVTNLNNLNNSLDHNFDSNSIDLKEIKCINLNNDLDYIQQKSTTSTPANDLLNGTIKRRKTKTNDKKTNVKRKSIARSFYDKFAGLRRYLNGFLCLLNIFLIVVDFVSDILIARYHFISENYIATSITICFIWWSSYMHFLFDPNFSKKLELFKRKFKIINLNNVPTDLLIAIVHFVLPVKIFIESIYLIYNMYKWECRLINCQNEERRQDIEVALRVCLRRAHKSNLILALFKAFPQFLYQYYHYVIYLVNDKETTSNWLFIITILSSLVIYIKNSYCGDLYYIEDNLNKNYEELRFLNIIKFNYLSFKFNIVLFIYNLTEFLLNFPFFLIFYRFKFHESIMSVFKEYDFYLFVIYIVLFFKSYVTFFKNYLTTMKLEKDEDANWKKDVLFIRKRSSNSHVNYLFILRLIVSFFFLISLSNTFSTKNYSLILFIYFMLIAITAVGYILKITIVADQLINLKNFYVWKSIFCHLENLNGFSIYNDRLFNQWIEKIIYENYYFHWKILIYNAYHIFFRRNST